MLYQVSPQLNQYPRVSLSFPVQASKAVLPGSVARQPFQPQPFHNEYDYLKMINPSETLV